MRVLTTLLGLTAVGVVIGGPYASAQEDVGLKFDKKGITLHFLEGRANLTLGGRFYLDVGDGDVSDSGAFDIFDKNVDTPQSRLKLTGTFDKWLTGVYEYDLSDNNQPLKDVAAGVKYDPILVSVGNFKEPFGLENLISDNDLTFMSRSLADTFTPGRHVGLSVATAYDNWTAAAGVFAGNINERFSQGVSFTGRTTWAPVRTDADIVHLGASIGFRNPDPNESSFNTRPESVLFNDRLVETGTLANTQGQTRFGLEAAWQHGPVRVQSEYLLTYLDRNNGQSDPLFQGGYVLVAWVVNGAGRRYSTELPGYGADPGKFGSVALDDSQRVSQGGFGVFEVAGRLSAIDLDDEDVAGGRQGDLTVGLNWYPDTNVRLMANYVRAQAHDTPTTGDNEHANIYQVRLQIAF